MTRQLDVEHLRHGLGGAIVAGWTQPPGGDDQRVFGEHPAQAVGQQAQVVGAHFDGRHLEAEVSQVLGEPLPVGVENLPSKQLVADGQQGDGH